MYMYKYFQHIHIYTYKEYDYMYPCKNILNAHMYMQIYMYNTCVLSYWQDLAHFTRISSSNACIHMVHTHTYPPSLTQYENRPPDTAHEIPASFDVLARLLPHSCPPLPFSAHSWETSQLESKISHIQAHQYFLQTAFSRRSWKTLNCVCDSLPPCPLFPRKFQTPTHLAQWSAQRWAESCR